MMEPRGSRPLATCSALLLLAGFALPLAAQSLSPAQQLARDIHKELVEINTVTATGDTAESGPGDGRAAEGRCVPRR